MSEFLCFGCMKNKGYEQVCPHCGYINGTKELPFSLKEGTVLSGRFVIGNVLKTGREFITYLGFDQSFLQTVLVVEYYPEKQVQRDARYTAKVTMRENQNEKVNAERKLFLEEGVLLTKQAGLSNTESAYQILEANNTAYIIMEYNEKNLSFVPLTHVKKRFWDRVPLKHKRMSGAIGLMLLAILLVIFIPRSIKMPDVTGLHKDKACELLNKAGIPYDLTFVFSADDDPDEIIYQGIPAGVKLKKENLPVKLTGNRAIKVPDMVGRDIQYALETLKESGLDYMIIEDRNAAYKPDIVSKQNPPTGNHPAKENFMVEIYHNQIVEMPDVTEMQFADAEKLLKEMNIEFTMDKVFIQDFPGNRVTAQEPDPGTRILNTDKAVVLQINTAANLPSLNGKDLEEAKEALHYAGYRKVNLTLMHSYEGMPGEIIYAHYDAGQLVLSDTIITIYRITDGELFFPDPILYSVVEKAAGKAEMSAIWALGVDSLSYIGSDTGKITNLDGIQYFKNMHTLELPDNNIFVLTPLAYTTGIQNLNVKGNSIRFVKGYAMIKNLMTQVNCLSEMKRLKTLNIADNLLTDLDGFESLTELETLILDGNRIKDISPLAGCTSLKTLSLVGVPVTDYSVLKSLTRLEKLEIDGDGDFNDFSLIR